MLSLDAQSGSFLIASTGIQPPANLWRRWMRRPCFIRAHSAAGVLWAASGSLGGFCPAHRPPEVFWNWGKWGIFQTGSCISFLSALVCVRHILFLEDALMLSTEMLSSTQKECYSLAASWLPNNQKLGPLGHIPVCPILSEEEVRSQADLRSNPSSDTQGLDNCSEPHCPKLTHEENKTKQVSFTRV